MLEIKIKASCKRSISDLYAQSLIWTLKEFSHSRKAQLLFSSLPASLLPLHVPKPSATLLDLLSPPSPNRALLFTVPHFLWEKVLGQFSSPPYMDPTWLTPGKYCIPGPHCSLLHPGKPSSHLCVWHLQQLLSKPMWIPGSEPALFHTSVHIAIAALTRGIPLKPSHFSVSKLGSSRKKVLNLDSFSHLPHTCNGSLHKRLSNYLLSHNKRTMNQIVTLLSRLFLKDTGYATLVKCPLR